MTVQYRCIYGVWETFCRSYFPWTGLDYRGESYWIVPGTLSPENT